MPSAAHTIHAFDYLEHPAKYPPAGVCAVFGDEPFLKQLVLRQLQHGVLEDDDTPFATFAGKTVEWRAVADELSTLTLFGGGKRLAVVEDADDFVRSHRSRLEEYVEKPKPGSVLILEVSTWASNTRLYKLVAERGLQVECRAPESTSGRRKVLDEERLTKWLSGWCQKQHGAKLLSDASRLLLQLVGPEFGLLDQALAKLALFTTAGGEISPELVRDVVGGWRTKTIWDLLDAACEGQTAEALRQLDRLLHAGEDPLALFGPLSWSLRRFAAATRIIQQTERERKKVVLSAALQQAGFFAWPKEAMEKAERHLKQLGRERAGQLYRWLLDADLALKGSHSSPVRARLILEQLIWRMSKSLAPTPARR